MRQAVKDNKKFDISLSQWNKLFFDSQEMDNILKHIYKESDINVLPEKPATDQLKKQAS